MVKSSNLNNGHIQVFSYYLLLFIAFIKYFCSKMAVSLKLQYDY